VVVAPRVRLCPVARSASPSEAPMPAHLAQVADVVAQAAAGLAGQGTW
jgi:hypothetical protein